MNITLMLLYVLISLEFLFSGIYFAWQWKLHSKRRASDIMMSILFFLFTISYIAYGFEYYNFEIPHIVGVTTDIILGVVVGLFFIRRLINLFWRKNNTN